MGNAASVVAEARKHGNELFARGEHADAARMYRKALGGGVEAHLLHSNVRSL